MSLLSFKIVQIPDLTLHKYQSLSDTGIEGVLKRHSDFLRQWHGIGLATGSSFHLLYCFDNKKEKGERLSLYFLIQSKDDETLELLKPIVYKNPLSDFYNFIECELPQMSFESGTTLIKNERVAEIYNPLADKTDLIHFVPHWEVDESARLYDLFRMMDIIGSSYNEEDCCAYRIDLFPVSIIKDTILEFTPVIKALQGDNDIKLVSNAVDAKTDSYAQTVKKEYDDWMSNIQTTPHFRVNIYAFANNYFASKMILNSAASEAINEGDFILANIKPDANGGYNILSRFSTQPEIYCQNKDVAACPTWATTFLLNEVEPFFRLPALFDGENIEIPKETSPKFVEEGLRIGLDNNGYVVNFPIKQLPKHAFFTGAPGSGKTNTMLHIVSQLKHHNIPFLVMEPAKKEYRELLSSPEMNDVYLFSPHLKSHFPLRINPFEFPKGVRLSDHIDAILGVFQGSFLLEGGVYKFLSASIEKAYTDLGWDIEVLNTGELEFPTLSDVYDILEDEINSSTYDSEIKGNMTSWLQVRLGNLMERGTGELFNTKTSTLSPEEWLTSSAIVELEVLGENAKNFFVLLLCNYILETLKIDPNGGVDSKTGKKVPVRHAIFIEEAHNIIAPTSQQSSSETVDPKVSATAYIVKMLAEVRALREAIIIADQLPTALAPEVTKNTGLKLIHRLTAQDDRELIGSAVSATPLQLEQVANFSMGKSLIFYEKTKKPFEVQVDLWEKPEINYNFADDKELFLAMAERRVMQLSIYKAFQDLYDKTVEKLSSMNSELEKDFEKYKSQRGNLQHAILIKNEMEFVVLIDKALKKTYVLEEFYKTSSGSNIFLEWIPLIEGLLDTLKQQAEVRIRAYNFLILEV